MLSGKTQSASIFYLLQPGWFWNVWFNHADILFDHNTASRVKLILPSLGRWAYASDLYSISVQFRVKRQQMERHHKTAWGWSQARLLLHSDKADDLPNFQGHAVHAGCHSVHCTCVVHFGCHYVHCVFVVPVGCYYVHYAFSLPTGCHCACAIYIRCHFAHCVVHVGCHYVHCASFVHVGSHYVYSVCVIMSDATLPTVPLSFMLFPEIIHWKCWVVPQMINWTLNLIVKVYAEKAFRQINALKRISKFSNEQCQIILYFYTNLFTQTLNIV